MLNDFTAVRCLLIPINQGQLLLPTAVIAEISHYARPQTIIEGQPEVMLGIIDWRQQQIPLLSMENLLSLPVEVRTPRRRTVIVYGLQSPQQLPFYAFLAIDIPKTITVVAEQLAHFSTDVPQGLAFSVQMAEHETVWVPNLGYLETVLTEQLLEQS